MESKTRWLTPLRLLFYPNNCPVCDTSMGLNEENLCFACESKLPVLPFTLFDKNPIEKLFFNHTPIKGASAYLSFIDKGTAQKLIHQVKYKGDKPLGKFLGNKAAKHLQSIAPEYKPDVIIPVPLHFSKEKKRGYNQAAVIGKGFANCYGLKTLENIVIRTKATHSQTQKSKYERFKNMEEVFSVINPKAIKNKHIMVLDDVITSGATTSALCAEVSKHHPLSICVYALAYKV